MNKICLPQKRECKNEYKAIHIEKDAHECY